MDSVVPLEVFASDPAKCLVPLARHLRQGSLSLFLGAGASARLGLQNWRNLVADCIADAGTNDEVEEDTSTDNLMKFMSGVERMAGDEYKSLVRKALYRNIPCDEKLFDSRLLNALGALLMKSLRGSISEVLTFNFDDVLERYLGLHGFRSQSVTSLPAVRGDVDVAAYHPHGFLPSSDDGAASENLTMSDDLVFSRASFFQRMGDRLNPWDGLLRDLLLRKVALFVGLSNNSATLMSALSDNADQIKECRGTVGVWLLGPDDEQDADQELMSMNIIPLRFDSYDDYPPFLFGICQRAADSSRKAVFA